MAVKVCFGWVAVILTILGVAGIFISGIVGLVWGPTCMLGDLEVQKDMRCRQIVRSKPIAVALIICGCMVLALTISIITMETKIQLKDRVEKSMAPKNASSAGGVAIPIHPDRELPAHGPALSLPQIILDRPAISLQTSDIINDNNAEACQEEQFGAPVSFHGAYVKKKSISMSENFSFADDSPKSGYENC